MERLRRSRKKEAFQTVSSKDGVTAQLYTQMEKEKRNMMKHNKATVLGCGPF